MKSSASKICLTSFDDLFQAGGKAEVGSEQIQEIPLAELFPFKDHAFQVRDDESMKETAESIAKYSVLVPGIVRPRSEGGYEIIAGHRRKRGCELAGKETMPGVIRELDDDEAIIVMVDSNLQREKILPSEKAFAYRMKLEAMKRQGQRTDLTSATVLQKLGGKTSREILAEQSGESHEQIRKYIRLTYLIPGILTMVDEDKIALRPAVELSYLSENEQGLLLNTMNREDCIPSYAQALKMRKLSQEGNLDTAAIGAALTEVRPAPLQVTLKKNRLKQYFPPSYTAQQMEEIILSLLDTWRLQQQT